MAGYTYKGTGYDILEDEYNATQPCIERGNSGTWNGYMGHYRRGEPICGPCELGSKEYKARIYRQHGYTPETPEQKARRSARQRERYANDREYRERKRQQGKASYYRAKEKKNGVQ